MNEEQRAVTPFELGVCSALVIIGAAIAKLNPQERLKIADAAKDFLKTLPADNSIIKDKSAHHLPLESLISGLLLEKSAKASE